jgi:hypothetical protein
LTALEAEVARLKAELERQRGTGKPWWEEIGVFANDPVYEKAMKLGRAYRRSLRPKKPSARRHTSPTKRLAKQDARPRHRSSQHP